MLLPTRRKTQLMQPRFQGSLPSFFSCLHRYQLWLVSSTATLAALIGSPTITFAQTTFPSVNGLNFQTSGRNRAANVGDWYTTQTSSSTDRLHRITINITPDMIAAGGGSAIITVEEAESNGTLDEVNSSPIGAVNCPAVSTCDPTRFTLRLADGVTIVQSRIVGTATGSGEPNGTTVVFNVTQPGTYQVTSETGAFPIFNNPTLNLNNDDNTFRVVVTPSGGLVGNFQGTIQQNTGAILTIPFFFLLGPTANGTSNLFLRNFDLDAGGTVTYTRPSSATINGTGSGNAVWNGSGNLNTGGDAVVATQTQLAAGGDAGIWGLTINNFTNNNQSLIEANADGGRLPLFDQPPPSAGNFLITVDNPPTPVGNQICQSLTVTNNFFTNDIINLDLSGTNLNNLAQLRDSAGNPPSDTDGDGKVDTGILVPGASITYSACVTPATPGVTTITGTSFMDNKVDPTNNATQVVTIPSTAQPSADLRLTKTANPVSPSIGQNVTYTITVFNDGPSQATNVAITEQLPAGLTFVSATPSQGAYDNSTGVWSVGAIANGGNATLQVVATLNTSSPVTNTVQVSASDQPDPDSTPGNGVLGEDDQVSVTVPLQLADLSLTKTASPPSPSVGQNVTYTVTIKNDGPDSATNVAVTEQLPAGLTFVSATPSQGAYENSTGVWTVGAIANGGNATLQVVATLNTSSPVTNTVQVSASDQPDPDSTPGNGVLGEDDQVSVTVPLRLADLSLTKTVSPTSPSVGQNITYTVTIRNDGPDSATNVAVTDQLTAGLTFVSATPSQGTYNNGSGIWTVGSLANGGSANLQIVATLNSADPVTNIAQVSALDQTDPDSAPQNNNPNEDDQASATVPLQQEPRLRLVKRITAVTRRGIPLSGFNSFIDDSADNNDTAPGWSQFPLIGVVRLDPQISLQSGDEVEYTIYFLSDGSQEATNIKFCDPIPAGTTFIADSFAPTGGILLNRAGSAVSQTNALDTDEGAFFGSVVPLPGGTTCANPAPPEGAVIVNLASVSNVSGSNFGFVRFRVKIN